MTGRKLLIALMAAALYAAVLVASASADQHRVRVTLVGGQVMTLTVDVPAGGSVTGALPALPGPVAGVEDLGPIETPSPSPTPELPIPTVGSPTPTETPTTAGGSANSGSGQATGSPTPAGTPAGAPNTGKGATGKAGANTRSLVGTVKTKTAPKSEPKHPVNRPDGTPTIANPTLSLSTPGPAAIGVPNFFIDKFRIPPFLLPLYQAAGIEYGVPWEVLAAINEIETDYGRNLNVSSAGALGWMQFMPATWATYGVDANGDGSKDPLNPADAIFAAARYLRAAGADKDLRGAIFAYNHANWYVDSVVLRARLIGGLPSNLVGSLTGLTQGRFPVQSKARYANALRVSKTPRRGNAAQVVQSTDRRGIEIYARAGAPAVAVQDGRIAAVGTSKRLGRYVQLQDVYGNTYTYAHLAKVVSRYPSPKPRRVTAQQIAKELQLPQRDSAPTGQASGTSKPAADAPAPSLARKATPSARTGNASPAPSGDGPAKLRLFAHPHRPAAAGAGGAQQVFETTGRVDGGESMTGYLRRVFGLERKDVQLKPLRKGARVVGGTILGRLGRTVPGKASHLLFEIRPAGTGAPRIDPKPILDGWKLLESTAIYRAAGRNPFVGTDAATPSIGQVLLMGKDALAQRVLADPRIQIYDCGRRDVQTGQVDRRVLATLAFLAASGFKPAVSSLHCGHSFLTASGNVSEHSSGNAVDIAAVNGIPIVGHQGSGSITELVIQRLLTLQGTMKPHQIISLMTFQGADNTFAMADHADHIHVGFRPLYGTNSKLAKQINAILRPQQWIKLIDRLGKIQNPTVRRTPSRFATKVKPRASTAHQGE
jgi:murein DD-endopeptidase MepM/ murein hydrolase activator NlpD